MDENKEIVTLEPGKVYKPDMISKPKSEIRRYMDKETIDKAIMQIKNHKYKMLFITLWMTGLRVSEINQIKKRDIDFKNKTIRVIWLKNRRIKERIVPLHQDLRALLELFTSTMNADDRIFPYTRQFIWQLSKKFFGVKTHGFRHSFAVHYLREGGRESDLYKLLGHSKIQTTMEYLKIVPTDLSKELDKIKY